MSSGDILGLGDVTPSSGPNDEIRNRASSPRPRETEEARRRHRMNEGADEVLPSEEHPAHHGSGAASVDMGSGGDGTDIE